MLILLLSIVVNGLKTTNRYYYSLTNLDNEADFDNCKTTVEDIETDYHTLVFVAGGTHSYKNIYGNAGELCTSQSRAYILKSVTPDGGSTSNTTHAIKSAATT